MSESVVSDICVDEVEDHGRGSMSFLPDPFVNEVEGNIEAPWFCVVVVSDIYVDDVERAPFPQLKIPCSITTRGIKL